MNNADLQSQLTDLLSKFKNEVLKENPSNLVSFAVKYFTELDKKQTDRMEIDTDERERLEETLSNDEFYSDDEYFNQNTIAARKSKLKQMTHLQIPRQSIISESFDPSSVDNETFEKNRKKFPKTPKQLDKISDILKEIFIFNCLEQEQIEKVIESMFLVEVYKGDVIIKECDNGDNFYVIDCGTFEATNQDKTIYEIYEGEGFFGELALLYNCPRAATIVALTDGSLWAIDRVTFRQLILKTAYQKRKRFLDFIKSVPILKELSEYDKCNLADALKTRVVNNERIITQGEAGDRMYFIEEGEAMVTYQDESEEVVEKRLYTGDYFGEVALLAKIPRIANVYAVGMIKLAELDVKSYDRLMGPCIDRMRKNFTKYRSRLESILSSEQLEELFREVIHKEDIAT